MIFCIPFKILAAAVSSVPIPRFHRLYTETIIDLSSHSAFVILLEIAKKECDVCRIHS
jgi:hypothetical protein